MIEIFCSKLCIVDMKDVWNGFYVVGVGGWGGAFYLWEVPKNSALDYVQTYI